MSSALGWAVRVNKLRAMRPGEILGRLRYRAVVGGERVRHHLGRLALPDRLLRSVHPRLQGSDWRSRLIASRQRHRTRFLPGVHDPVAMRRLFETRYARERAAMLHQAALVRHHRFEFFGQQFQYGETIDWQADPVTGTRWPSDFHADVPVHRGDIGCGDVKHVWELSRQQYVIDLGKAYFLERNPEDLQALRTLVQSWIRGNPYATGVNWACALEPAFRVFSWLWAYYLTVDALDDEFHVEWLEGFYDHGRFLDRHLEHYSSPYNHLIGEATALYMIGACFPEFRDADRWKARARAVLERRLQEQFYADGGSVEQSTFYHHATVGFYLLAGLTARATGEDLSDEIWTAIAGGLDFSMALVQPGGTIPEIGGADDGKPIRMEHLPFWDFRPYHAIGAVLFDRGDFKAVAGRFHEDALWLLGPTGLARFEALVPAAPTEAARALDASGYYVMRSDWSERADYVCFDCGEQAAGMRPDGVPNSMHGHADCLSVIAWLDGRRVLVDSGLYAYNCGGPWEAHFRETAAHNTARVDGRDQALHLGKMAWSNSYRARLEGWTVDEVRMWVLGSHDGYAREPNGVTHRRAVLLRPGGYFIVYDEFTGDGAHDLEVIFQFAPGVLRVADEGRALFDGFADAVWMGSIDWSADVSCGGPQPDDGWIAASLGVRQPAPRLRLRTRSAERRTSLITAVATQQGVEPRIAITRAGARDADGRLLVVSHDNSTEWVAAGGITRGGAIETDAYLAICLIGADRSIETTRVGGTFVRSDVEWLVQHGSSKTSWAKT